MRTLLLLAFFVLAAGCSYDDVSSAEAPIQLRVDGIPATAVRLEVTVTDAASGTQSVHPHFGQGAVSSMSLSLPPPAATGAFTVQVQAFDSAGTQVASGAANGSYSGPSSPVSLQVTLR